MPLNAPPLENLSEKLRDRIVSMRDAKADVRAIEAMANAPHIQKFYMQDFYKAVFFGGVAPRRAKELVRLRLSNLHGCAG